MFIPPRRAAEASSAQSQMGLPPWPLTPKGRLLAPGRTGHSHFPPRQCCGLCANRRVGSSSPVARRGCSWPPSPHRQGCADSTQSLCANSGSGPWSTAPCLALFSPAIPQPWWMWTGLPGNPRSGGGRGPGLPPVEAPASLLQNQHWLLWVHFLRNSDLIYPLAFSQWGPQ